MQELSEKQAWQDRWHKGLTGWDQGEAHPSLPKLIAHARREGGLVDGARFYSAGAGRAHSEAALAQAGYPVRAVELSREAIEEARDVYGSLPNLELLVGDLFDIPESERKAFDAVYDRAMLCALAPGARPGYIEAMKARLKDSGLFCAILFRQLTNEQGPPYPVDEAEAMRVLGKDFHLCFAAAIAPAPRPAVVIEEWICIWRLRGQV